MPIRVNADDLCQAAEVSEDFIHWVSEGIQGERANTEGSLVAVDSGSVAGQYGGVRPKEWLYLKPSAKYVLVAWRIIGLDATTKQTLLMHLSSTEGWPPENGEFVGFQVDNTALKGVSNDGSGSQSFVDLGVTLPGGWQDSLLVAIWDVVAGRLVFHVDGVRKASLAAQLPPTGKRYWLSLRIKTAEDANKRVYAGNSRIRALQ